LFAQLSSGENPLQAVLKQFHIKLTTIFLLLLLVDRTTRFPRAIIYSGAKEMREKSNDGQSRAPFPPQPRARFQLCNFIYWKLFSSHPVSSTEALFACWLGKTFSALFVFANKVPSFLHFVPPFEASCFASQ
jgi:hypothetical protein